MTFEDLPDTWAAQPLEDPGLAADVVDLLVGHADRLDGCLCLLLLDHDLRLVQPLMVAEVGPERDPWGAREGLLAVLAPLDIGGVLGARGRDGSVLLTDTDRQWHEMLLDVCRHAEVPLLGAYLATPGTVRAFPPPLGAFGDVAS
ncbi:hypothetical protein H9L10_09420 [Phycicoccus endophyticus]|uniref:DUF4192 family protein n=1 Tax=Phycicoccus endophyticus TaxID=1690220 RepID=A0A7G9QYW6_9MICO|nr:hypothetical protein [Phycicoccus endophyticus]QNN48541.1 hypothetical protein H9L10_09420 [Phycicoccus endophyticus]